MPNITIDAPGTVQLLMGNEAIARGALEAGVRVATAYPGNPSSEIIATLAQAAREREISVEWSVNEKVALEIAAAASFANVRALTAMKQNGLNVAIDFLGNLNLTGVRSGLVLVVCDDPGGISSTNEQDSRHVPRSLDLPLLEPATLQEAKEMTRWAFELSEAIGNICLVRSVTRISHARGNVVFGELPPGKSQAYFDTSQKPYGSIVVGPSRCHQALHRGLSGVREIFEMSPFNWYAGPENPELLIITCGSGWFYSKEAVKILRAEDVVGILKLGTTWPLPKELIERHLLRAGKVLIIEEIDAFLETNVKEIFADLSLSRSRTFYGKTSGHIDSFGELNPDIVVSAVAKALRQEYFPRHEAYQQRAQEVMGKYVPSRELQFCAGCPHRATFWAVKDALKLDDQEGVLTGDIGCNSLAIFPTGFSQIRTVHSMGSGAGLASGLGKLKPFGFHQPVLTACGDSTFFHAVIPALINGVHSQSDFILLLLDNAGTAMTGFQPHPGSSVNALGEAAPVVDAEALCHALGIPVVITDPYDIKATMEKLLDLLREGGKPRVLICRRECALIRARKEKPIYTVRINSERCIGEACGCNRFCTRVFKCPGLIWDREAKKAKIDEAICIGCGVCADICPQSAVIREETQ